MTNAISTPAAPEAPEAPEAADTLRPARPLEFVWTKLDTVTVAIIAALAIFTRFVGLTVAVSKGTPVFDEKHYVPQAYDMVRSTIDPITGGIELNPGYGLVVHPPLAKQLIALGEYVFGYSPMGWRLSAAVFGVAVVLLIQQLARRVSGSTMVGFIAGLVAVCDGVLTVGSRFGMLDIFQVFFVVLAAYCILCDSQQMQWRLFNAYHEGLISVGGTQPRFGFRWWRFAAGVALGMTLSIKWNGLYYIAFFGLLSVLLDAHFRNAYRLPHPIVAAWKYDVAPALASLVAVPIALYFWSWRAWFASETSVYRHPFDTGVIDKDSPLNALPESIAGFFYYHASVLKFHSSLTSSGGHHHPWDSKPWSWLAATRPILYFSEPSDNPTCFGSSECTRMIYLFGTPAIWWLTVPVVAWACWKVFATRNMNLTIPVVGFMASFLPWLAAYDRQMYFFYAEPLVPFTIVLLAVAAGYFYNRGRVVKLPMGEMPIGRALVMAWLALVVIMYIYFSPIIFGYSIPTPFYNQMMWLPSWH